MRHMEEQQQLSVELPDLPESVWKHVMQYVGLKDRLCSCSRVSKKLHRASLAATDNITWTVPEDKPYLQADVVTWLSASQHQVTSLRLSNARQPLRDLQSPHLQVLQLQQCSISQQGLLHSLQHLTQLSLQFCMLSDGLESLAGISALTNLQHLVLGALMDGQQQGVRQLSAPDLLPNLTGLTHLEISKRLVLTAASMQQLSCLTDLSTLILHLRSSSEVSTAALQAMQHCQRLQQLDLNSPGVPIDLSTAPFLSRASSLLQFRLLHGTLALPALAALTQLQQLDLNHVQVLPDAAALLMLLPALQQLQRLRVGFLQCQWPPVSTAYSAIAACSNLQHLELSGCQLPAEPWQEIFPANARLPHLTTLLLGQVLSVGHVQPAMDTADAARMAACCPELQELQLWRQLDPSAELHSLQQLTALTRLWLAGVSQEALSSLAAVTTLQDLYVVLGEPLFLLGDFLSVSRAVQAAPEQLQQLTTLTQLTRLMVHMCGEPGGVSLSNKVSLPGHRVVMGYTAHVAATPTASSLLHIMKQHCALACWVCSFLLYNV